MSLRILVAVDGSEYSLRAVEHVLRLRDSHCDIEPHLLNVQMPLESGHVKQFIARESTRARGAMPALLTSASILPNASIVFSTMSKRPSRSATLPFTIVNRCSSRDAAR